MNVCHCGAQAGYPHPLGCPFPYYGDAPHLVRGWQLAAADLAQANDDATRDDEGGAQ